MNIEKMFPEGEELIYVDCSAVALNFLSFDSVKRLGDLTDIIRKQERFTSSREILEEIKKTRDHYKSMKRKFSKGHPILKVLSSYNSISNSLSERVEKSYKRRDKSQSRNVSGFIQTCKGLSNPDKSLLEAALLNNSNTGIFSGDKRIIDSYIEGASKFGFQDCFVCDRNISEWETREEDYPCYYFINSKDI